MTTTRGTLRLAERWLSIPGYGGAYEVSDRGSVRSLTRPVDFGDGRMGLKRGGVMKTQPGPRGHLRLGLSRDGVRQGWNVHSLVLLAFVGPRPEGLVSRHLDGNELNNNRSNLRYGTYSENALDSVLHGTHPEARLTHCLRDHEFTEENTRIDARGARECRECRRVKNKKTGERRTAERRARGLKRFLRSGEAAQVERVRDMYAGGQFTQAEIAHRFGLGQSTVSRWVRGETRPDLPGVLTNRGKGHGRRAA